MTEYRDLTKELCSLPKSSIAKIQMPDDIRDEVYATIRHEQHRSVVRGGPGDQAHPRATDDEALPIPDGG